MCLKKTGQQGNEKKVQPPQDINGSDPLNRARDRRIFIQRPVRSDFVVIVGIGSQDPPQMRLAQDDEVVHALAPDRSDQPFGEGILPRRGWCRRLVPDAHGALQAGPST